MIEWDLTFQDNGLPVSIARADGVPDTPPEGVIRYVELSYGAWTLDAAVDAIARERVEWPKRCDPEGWLGCRGTMEFVGQVADTNIWSETGEEIHPAGWECQVCRRAEVGGLSAVVISSWTE